jgi:chorismate mutase/prephenate dehydrogenase
MDLEEIRKKISNLDDQIIDLIARREAIVNEVSQYKIQEGIPIRDFTREKKVINRAREKADQLSLNANMIESVMQLLIKSSLSKQEKIRVTSKNIGRDRRALVIGGKGKMGVWMDEFLTSQGYEVFISDLNALNEEDESIDWAQDPLDYDIIVVATPLSKTGDVLLELAKLKPRGLIIDIASLKSPLRKGLGELKKVGCKVTSIHPMFGPDTRLLSHKHLVLIDLGDTRALTEVTELFSSTMVDMVVMSLDEHDKVMGYILGLSHIINIAFMDVLVNSGEHLQNLKNISSTSFNAQLNVATRVTQDNPDLYFEIQALNEFGRHPVNEIVASLNNICKLIDEDEKEGFVNIMLKGRVYKNKVAL